MGNNSGRVARTVVGDDICTSTTGAADSDLSSTALVIQPFAILAKSIPAIAGTALMGWDVSTRSTRAVVVVDAMSGSD